MGVSECGCVHVSIFHSSIYLFSHIHMYVSVYYLSIYLSIYLSTYLSIINLYIHPTTIQKAISSPSEVRAGWNCLVAGSGRREVSSHTPTAVPAAMAAPRTVISQKSGRTLCICVCVCVYVCVTQCDKNGHLTKVRTNCVYMWGCVTGERETRERIGKERRGKGKRDEGKERETRERKERRGKGKRDEGKERETKERIAEEGRGKGLGKRDEGKDMEKGTRDKATS